MSITNTNKVFNVDNQEYGYVYEDFSPVEGNIAKMTVPKITGAISDTGKKSISVNNLFDNARGQCYPVFDTKIVLNDYMLAKVKRLDNYHSFDCSVTVTEGSASASISTKYGTVPKGTRLMVEFVNGNIQSAFVTSK